MARLTHWPLNFQRTLLTIIIVYLFGTTLSCVPQPSAPLTNTDPEFGTKGAWSNPIAWPIPAVHMHLLPTGKVLLFPGEESADPPHLWDPNTGDLVAMAHASYDIFCSGHSFLPNGNLFVTGGHGAPISLAVDKATIFDQVTETWLTPDPPPMAHQRFYPTNTTLANGDILVFGGFGLFPEVWRGWPNNQWRELTDIPTEIAQINYGIYYASMHLTPDGRVFNAGPQFDTYLFDTAGNGSWESVGDRQSPQDPSEPQETAFRYGGVSVMVEPGKVVYFGGGPLVTDNEIAWNTAEVIDLQASKPAWRKLSSLMSEPRRDLNATILADGKVLITGGNMLAKDDNGNPIEDPPYAAELWDPATEQFSAMAGTSILRKYHSTALLLPDGTVVTSGGDNKNNAEIFSPPYLDEAAHGPRPAIFVAAQELTYGEVFSALVSNTTANDIAKVHFIRLGSVTHSTNMTQRLVPLNSRVYSDNELTITAPTNPNEAPPGYYMLFLVNGNGVPSRAAIINLVQPDLFAGFVSGPASAQAGSTISVYDSIVNRGTRNAGIFLTAIFLSTDPVNNPLETYVAGQYVGEGLAKGASLNRTNPVTIPSAIAPGTYYIVTAADVSETISEWDEANNIKVGNQITITQ